MSTHDCAATPRPRPALTRRPLAALLLACASATAVAPAPAGAAREPTLPPLVRTATFRVALEATQTTTWRLVAPAATRDCTAGTTSSGGGREVVRLRSKGRATGTLTAAGRTAFLTVTGRTAADAPDATSTVTRSSTVRTRTVPGTCGDNPGQDVTPPNDCGSIDAGLTWLMTYERGRLAVRSTEAHPAPLVRFGTCEVHAADDVEEAGITASGTRIPVRDLLDRRQRKHVVLGRRTWRLERPGVVGRTTVTWTATLARRGR